MSHLYRLGVAAAALCLLLAVSLFAPVFAADDKPKQLTLITNVNIFDGKDEKLLENANVLIEGNLIKQVSTKKISAEGATVIEGDGRTLMPGLIDAHWHGVIATASVSRLLGSGPGYWNLIAAAAQRDTLYRGFTTVRDAGGPMFDIKRATDEGLIEGPRVYPSGAMISQTSGHGDFRSRVDLPAKIGHLNPHEIGGMYIIADGVPEVIKRVRENLMQGASQIKLMSGGGVSSLYDPIHTIQYTDEELQAAVKVAGHWGTYVMTHSINDEAVNHSLDAGVKSIEHGHLATRKTLERMAKEGAWLSIQPFLDDEDAPQFEDPISKKKYKFVVDNTDNVYRWAKELGVKIAFGTDTLFDAKLAKRQGAQLAKLKRWFTPYETLKMATSTNAELLALSGELNPYPAGPLGVVEEGAYADLILVDGNPLENLDLIADAEKNFKVIMKDGKIFKNTLN